MLPVMVAQSPVVVRLVFLPDSSIYEYGGGVFIDAVCSKESLGHNMLVVGHGL